MAVPYVELKDKFGNDFRFGHCGDIFIPPFPLVHDFRLHMRAIKDMDIKPNDVIIAGYPKTGTHWHHEILKMLIRGSSEYSKMTGPLEFLEFKTPEKGSNPPDSEPRVFFTHLKWQHLPKQVFEKKVKIVYLLRNPKDTWVSYHNHVKGHKGQMAYEATWSQFFQVVSTFGLWYGDWFDYVQEWEQVLDTQTDVPVFVSYFEDLKENPVGQIEKLDQFLGCNRGRQLCEAIADACNFTTMKVAMEAKMPEEFRKKLFKDNAPGFYRKGEIGDWKNWFTVAENELFDDLYQKRMQDSKLQFTYE